jgi:hypothetical protein
MEEADFVRAGGALGYSPSLSDLSPPRLSELSVRSTGLSPTLLLLLRRRLLLRPLLLLLLAPRAAASRVRLLHDTV